MVSLSTAVLWNVVDALPEQAMKPEAVDITGLQAASQPTVAAAPHVAASQPETELLASLPPDEPEMASQPAAKPAQAAVPPALPVVAATAAAAAVAAKPKVEAVAPAPAVAKPEAKPAPKPEPVAKPAAKPAAHPEHKPEAKPEPKPEPKVAVKEPAREPAKEPKETKTKPAKDAVEKKTADPMAILEGREAHAEPAKDKPAAETAKKNDGGKRFSIQLAALSDPQKVDALRSRLAAAGVAAHFAKVQTSKGDVTRVRVGPFKSRDEADAAMHRLSKAGVSGIVVGVE
jgi:DedD protein